MYNMRRTVSILTYYSSSYYSESKAEYRVMERRNENSKREIKNYTPPPPLKKKPTHDSIILNKNYKAIIIQILEFTCLQ